MKICFLKIMDREGNFYDQYSSVPESKQRYFCETIFPPVGDESAIEKLHLERWYDKKLNDFFRKFSKYCFSFSIRILPHQQDTGGFFVALLKKTSDFPWSKSSSATKQAVGGNDENSKNNIK